MSISGFNVTEGTDPTLLFGNILGFVLLIVAFIGGGILIYGISQLVQAFQEKAPDAMQRGVVACLVGIVMIGMRVILTIVGIGN